MKATLEAEVEIWNIAVFAELAVWEQRPDLQLLCMLARDRGGLDEGAIDSVLPGLSERARTNLVRHLGYVQLTDRYGSLTALGRHCASSGEAPAWEQGAYHLLVARHPLFDSYILDFKRASGDAYDRDFDLDELPRWLSPDRDRVFTSAIGGTRRFSLGAFPAARGHDPACRGWELEPGKLSWEIDLQNGANQWTISGSIGNKQPLQYKSAPESVDPAELMGLYAGWDSRWDARQGRVAMSYDGRAGADGRESFLRSWRFESVKVGRFGTFDGVVVRDVPVGPASNGDAQTWAKAIAVARAESGGAFVSPGKWRSLWSEIATGTPLAGRAGLAPVPTEVGDIGGRPLSARTRWLISAGTDLGMGA